MLIVKVGEEGNRCVAVSFLRGPLRHNIESNFTVGFAPPRSAYSRPLYGHRAWLFAETLGQPFAGRARVGHRSPSRSSKDCRHDARQKTMTLEAEEFIRRFLLHVLPEGFQRIR